MKVHVLKPIQTAQHGRLNKGAVVEMHPSVAGLYLPVGAVERIETKEIRENPTRAAGTVPPPSALPAAQASPQTIASESGGGKKRRQRAPKAQPE